MATNKADMKAQDARNAGRLARVSGNLDAIKAEAHVIARTDGREAAIRALKAEINRRTGGDADEP